MSKEITELTSDTFESFVKSGVVVIDFWALWCGPCKIMAPIFEDAAKDLKGKVHFAKVNVDEESDLAQQFEVMSIPTMIIFKNGKQIDRAIGVIEKEELLGKISEAQS